MVDAELVKDARKSRHSLYLTSLDLRDAFGLTSHDLILFLLRWARVPEPVCRYISDFLARLRMRVHTKQWTTDAVPIRVGTMQGDTSSPILFLLVINPIIMYLHQGELKHGYVLKRNNDDDSTSFISTPFADDFNLLTRSSATPCLAPAHFKVNPAQDHRSMPYTEGVKMCVVGNQGGQLHTT